VNGVLAGSQASSPPIDVTNGALHIGGDRVWMDECFPGVIDEVRIDSRARSAQALQAEMATPVVGAAH
jgi:hypothetical protein